MLIWYWYTLLNFEEFFIYVHNLVTEEHIVITLCKNNSFCKQN